MPPFTKKLLSDDELRNIMAYVNSIHQHKKNKNENIGSGK
jgi:mono/diheme cytochrome c family protein